MHPANGLDDFSFSIALVNYKTPEVTKLCLDLLYKALDVNKIPIWVVDNDSKDESLAHLKSLNWINLLERKPILNEHGFMAHGRALDLILDHINTDYLLLIHTDTLIYDASIIKQMLQNLSRNNKAAAIGCLEQVNRTRLATIWRVVIRAIKYYFRRIKVSLGIGTREPRLFYEIYLKSFCTLWNVGIVKRHKMRFAMVERIPGYEMQDQLRKLGYEFLSIPPHQMFQYLDHIEAGTVSHVKGLAKNHKRVKNYQAIINKINKI
jgi:glycosyltransferase involved in cell wall biosynthesis